jgi:hypothetical protein
MLYESLEFDDQQFEIDTDKTYPLLAARSQNEYWFWLTKTAELGYLEFIGSGGDIAVYQPTLSGWKLAAELKQLSPKGNQAFVAMFFADSMNSTWLGGLKPAIEKSGYLPMMLKEVQHNDNINDKIIAEIRRSALVVVDFTEQKGGSYFEAGFALGLGIPVIWCCNSSERDKLHFDTRQYNHIFYHSPEELLVLLYDRIQATVPIGKSIS